MKASILFATGLILAAGTVLGSINAAHAGDGGSAGSISAEFTAVGNNLTGTAGAVAVGKLGAATSARTTGADISAVAVGGGGVLTISNINGVVGFAAADDLLLGTSQGSVFTGTNRSSVNLVPATVGVTLR